MVRKISPAKTLAAEADVDDNFSPSNQSNGYDTQEGLTALMAELSAAASTKITVYRYIKGKPLAYIAAYEPAESFSLDDLRDDYNGGEFRLLVSRDGTLYKTIKVYVEEGRQRTRPIEADTTSESSSLERVLLDGFERQAELLRDRAASPAPAPADGGVRISDVLSNLPAVITAVAAAITALRPPPPPPAPANDTTDILLRGIELGKSLSEGSNGEPTSLLGIAREALRSPLIMEAVKASIPQPAAPQSFAPVQQQLPRPQPAQPQPQAQPAPSPEFSPAKTQEDPSAMLSFYLNFLAGKAASSADPDLYADLVLDNLSDEQLTMLLNAPPSTLEYLKSVNPVVAQHEQWFATLIETIRGALDNGEESVVDSAHATGTPPPAVPG